MSKRKKEEKEKKRKEKNLKLSFILNSNCIQLCREITDFEGPEVGRDGGKERKRENAGKRGALYMVDLHAGLGLSPRQPHLLISISSGTVLVGALCLCAS